MPKAARARQVQNQGKPQGRGKKSLQRLNEGIRAGQVKLGRGNKSTLSYQEELFCQFYVSDPKHNGTQAAIKAGYAKHSARQFSHNLLCKPKIKAYCELLWAPIKEAIANRLKRTKLSDGRLLEEDVAIMASDIRNYGVIENGRFYAKDSLLWSDEAAAAVRSVSQTDFGVKIQLHDKHPSLTRLMKIQKLLEPDVSPAGQATINNIVNFYLPEKRALEVSRPTVITLPAKDVNGQARQKKVTAKPVTTPVADSHGNGDSPDPDAELT